MADLDLAYTPAVELVRLIRERSLSPVELMENCLARIEELNPRLNCFCFVFADEALALAREAEEAAVSGVALGPMHGLPVAIKDVTPTAGKTTTRGSKMYEHWVPEEDALIVRRLARAGAIMVGKTTTPEFAYDGFTESPLWGITRNPWNTERTPGGSSGGSGAAVASGCVPLAEGTDMGGSVRIPASFCGLVGLKPSLGRIPMDILPTVFDTISHFGPLARTVADAALFMNVTGGPYERDILSLPDTLELPIPPEHDVRGMKLALSPDLGYYAIDDEVEQSLRDTAEGLRESGATVEEVELGWSREINDAWFDQWGVYLDVCFTRDFDEWRDRMDPEVVSLIERGRRLDAVTFKRMEIVRTRQWHRLCDVFERFDALLCPTMSMPAPRVGQCDSDFQQDRDDGRFNGLDMTCPFNFVGQCPAISVPAGFSREGLPIGVQIVGHRFDDPGVMRVAGALERIRPWAQRRPRLLPVD